MTDLSFIEITRADEIAELAEMARSIWNEYWPPIIGQDQTTYMVEKFQSLEAFERDMRDNCYEYWFIEERSEDGNMRRIGYTGGHAEPEEDRFFISKIYLLKEARGGGRSSQITGFYERLCRDRGLSSMYLTVNKHNDLAISAYKKNGFETIDAVETDIGNGFVMDDYIMEKEAAPRRL